MTGPTGAWNVSVKNYFSFIRETQKIFTEFWKNENNCWRYHHFTNAYQKPQSLEVQFLRYGVRQTQFFVILGHFLPFYIPNNLENQNSEKIKKESGGVIILHIWTKNYNQMIYALPSFNICVPKITIIWCTVLEIWSKTDRIFCRFGPFFPLLPH